VVNRSIQTLTNTRVIDEGGGAALSTQDDSVECLLVNILEELKIMNFHLSLINDEQITKDDI